MDLPVGFLVCLHCNLRIQFRIWFWYVLSMWDPHWSSLSCSWKFSPYSKAKLYDWFSHSMGIKRPWQLVSHSSLRWKMHGNRRNHYDPYLTTAKHVDTACRCNRSLPFASDLFLSVLPQDNFIIMLFHFTFNQRVICPLIFSSFIQRNYRWQVVYILFMQCMVFVCVIWSFDEMGLREQVILSDKGNRETEQIMLFYFKKRSGHQEKM